MVAYLSDFAQRPRRRHRERLQQADRLRRRRHLPHHLRQAQRGLERLQHLVVETINDLLAELRQRNGIEPYEIHEVAVAGNTTMTHLLLGLDPRYLREEPYIPTISLAAASWWPASSACDANMQARVHCLPSVGSYVGGDITAGVISSGMYAADELTLFIDIGTNGEMVLGNKDWLLSCACSAGPAFEGGGVGHGMRATAGAIEDVYVADDTYEPDLSHGRRRPAPWASAAAASSTCSASCSSPGSSTSPGTSTCEAPTARIRVRDGVPEYVVVPGRRGRRRARHRAHRVGHRQPAARQGRDLRGLLVLCRSVGVDLADVEQILIGGAFGQYINVEKAIRIGLLPDLPVERFHFLGNTSAQGAYAALLVRRTCATRSSTSPPR